jgi:hypothetical protein
MLLHRDETAKITTASREVSLAKAHLMRAYSRLDDFSGHDGRSRTVICYSQVYQQ